MSDPYAPGTLCLTKRPYKQPGILVSIVREISIAEGVKMLVDACPFVEPSRVRSAHERYFLISRPIPVVTTFNPHRVWCVPIGAESILRPIAGPGLNIDIAEAKDTPVPTLRDIVLSKIYKVPA